MVTIEANSDWKHGQRRLNPWTDGYHGNSACADMQNNNIDDNQLTRELMEATVM